MAPQCASTTRPGWPSSISRKLRGLKSTPILRKSPRAKKKRSRSGSRADGPGWRLWLARISASHSSLKDIVEHFEKRQEALDGKAMIVCMSRRICAEMYDAIVKLRPEWHDPDDEKGVIKVVITGSASDKETPAAPHQEQEEEKGPGRSFQGPQ